MLKGKKIAVYVTGGIAAYKAPDFVRHLIKEGAEVRVAMTPSAARFVTAFTFEVLTKYPVLQDGQAYPDPVGHIHLADWLDLAIVLPATANSLAKLAQGIADNEVLASLLAVNKPILTVPAMNNKMWAHPATQRNIEALRQDGVIVLEPATGFLAEGYEGKGRMPEPVEVLAAVHALAALSQTDDLVNLKDKRVVISAGGTQEAIDPVRYISNRSSGKMGLALAHVASMAGAEVVLVRTPSARNLPCLPQIKTLDVEAASQLYYVMMEEIETADIVIMAAAVSDYRSKTIADKKIKKDKTVKSSELSLELVENPDILASLPKDQAVVVGFAAETHDVIANAESKLHRKGADMIVANDVSQADIGFGSSDNAVTLVTRDGHYPVLKASKYQIARAILQVASQIEK